MSEHKIKPVEQPPGGAVDEAELQFDFGIQDGQVVVDFGKSIRWFKLPPDDAMQFAFLMAKIAEQAAAGATKAVIPS